MEPYATIDGSLFTSKVNSLYDCLDGQGQGGDASRMIANESRSFLRRQIQLTPPRTKQQGEDAIQRDLSKIFTPVNGEMLSMIGSQFGTSGIDEWITGSDKKDIHLQWDKIDPSGSSMGPFHQANRNRRGRTRNLKRSGGRGWYSPFVVSYETFGAYLNKIQSHVGRRKAGWAVSLKEVGGTVASWIWRHVGSDAPGDVINNLHVKNHPSITMRNYAPGIEDDRRIFNDNLRMTAASISKKMKLILQGYIYDWNSGKVIRPKEAQEAMA